MGVLHTVRMHACMTHRGTLLSRCLLINKKILHDSYSPLRSRFFPFFRRGRQDEKNNTEKDDDSVRFLTRFQFLSPHKNFVLIFFLAFLVDIEYFSGVEVCGRRHVRLDRIWVLDLNDSGKFNFAGLFLFCTHASVMPEDILTKCMRVCCCGPARAPGYGGHGEKVGKGYGNDGKMGMERPDTVQVNGQTGYGFCHHAPPGECPVCNSGTGPRSYRMPPRWPQTEAGPWLARYWGEDKTNSFNLINWLIDWLIWLIDQRNHMKFWV